MGELHLDIYVERMRREYKVDCEVGRPKVRGKAARGGRGGLRGGRCCLAPCLNPQGAPRCGVGDAGRAGIALCAEIDQVVVAVTSQQSGCVVKVNSPCGCS
jgi:hypothetical protein